MKATLSILLLFIATALNAQSIDSSNFFSVVKGTWVAKYYNADWTSMQGLPSPDTVVISQSGSVNTTRTIEGKQYPFSEAWVYYDARKRKIYYAFEEFGTNKSETLERYSVLSITKNEMKVSFIGYSELAPDKPVKCYVVFRRIK